MIPEILVEHDDQHAAITRMNELKKKNPNANYSVIKGAKTGKHHVVHHTSGGMRMVEEVETPSFADFLGEGQFDSEYHPILKKHGFKKSTGGTHKHPEHGTVTVNKHGEWKHVHPKETETHEGSIGSSLDRHLSSMTK